MNKVLSAVLTTVLAASCAVTLTGCKDKNTIYVGTNAAFAPFEMKDGSEIIGFDMDLIRAYGESVGKKVVIKDMEFNAALTSAQKGKVDVAVAGITKNETREKVLAFTDAYYSSTQVITVKNDNALATTLTALVSGEKADEAMLKALEGKKIGVQDSTTGHFLAAGDEDWGFDGIAGAEIKPYSNGGLAMAALNNGQIDAVILDEEPSKAIVKANYSSSLTVLPTVLTSEDYAIATKKGNDELVASLNKFIQTAKEDGTYDKLIQKYFG